jgi:hypothetical protein
MVRRVLIGSALLAGGAVLVDVGFATGAPQLERVGNAAMVLAGIGLAFLPLALARSTRTGRLLYWTGLALASLIDVPAVVDPSDLGAGKLLGVPAMLLLSAGFLLLWRAQRIPALLVGALWFAVQFGPNLALFILPTGRPSFVLQVVGAAAATASAAVAAARAQRSGSAVTRDTSAPRARRFSTNRG